MEDARHVCRALRTVDAELTLKLWNYLSTQLTQEQLWPIANLELKLLPCLVDMTWRGVRVDQDRVERTRNHLIKEEKATLAKIKHVAGRDVELWAAASIAKAFDKLEHPVPTHRNERPVLYQIVSGGPPARNCTTNRPGP